MASTKGGGREEEEGMEVCTGISELLTLRYYCENPLYKYLPSKFLGLDQRSPSLLGGNDTSG